MTADSILRKVFKDKVLRGAENETEANILLVSDFSYFDSLLGGSNSFSGKKERQLIKKVCVINPRRFGVQTRKIGIQAVPEDLVKIPPLKYSYQGEKRVVWTQYVTRQAHAAFQKMNLALKKDLGAKLFIKSGYRSPAYQLNAFLRHWQLSGYDFMKTLRLVALPGYSEHSDPNHQALDIVTAKGIPDDLEDYPTMTSTLQKTKEYQWLLKNAKRFGFKLSYPSEKSKDIVFEPWHWRYVGEKVSRI